MRDWDYICPGELIVIMYYLRSKHDLFAPNPSLMQMVGSRCVYFSIEIRIEFMYQIFIDEVWSFNHLLPPAVVDYINQFKTREIIQLNWPFGDAHLQTTLA